MTLLEPPRFEITGELSLPIVVARLAPGVKEQFTHSQSVPMGSDIPYNLYSTYTKDKGTVCHLTKNVRVARGSDIVESWQQLICELADLHLKSEDKINNSLIVLRGKQVLIALYRGYELDEFAHELKRRGIINKLEKARIYQKAKDS